MTEFFAFLQILHFVQSARCDVGMDKIVIQRKGSVTAASTARTEVTKPDVVMLNTSIHVALACVYGGGGAMCYFAARLVHVEPYQGHLTLIGLKVHKKGSN